MIPDILLRNHLLVFHIDLGKSSLIWSVLFQRILGSGSVKYLILFPKRLSNHWLFSTARWSLGFQLISFCLPPHFSYMRILLFKPFEFSLDHLGEANYCRNKLSQSQVITAIKTLSRTSREDWTVGEKTTRGKMINSCPKQNCGYWHMISLNILSSLLINLKNPF